METESISGYAEKEAEPVTAADLVVGFLTEFDPDTIAKICNSLQSLSGSPRIAVLQANSAGSAENANAVQPGIVGGKASGSVFFLSSPSSAPVGIPRDVADILTAYRSIFAVTEKLGARGCCILASQLQPEVSQSVCHLAQTLLEGDHDLVVPRYTRQKFKGLLNSSVISPLMRSLYGKRIRNPMGPDVAVSRRLSQRMLETERSSPSGTRHPLASLAPIASCNNLKICEVHLGVRLYPTIDWANTSSLLAQALGPVFLDIERNAVCWQRSRGSVAVPVVGAPVIAAADGETINVSQLVDSFQLGNRELQEVWALVLPPTTLLELRKLLRLSAEQFHMPDELWVRIVFDFALAHRLQTISRDHLLKSLTPLYLGWVASYATDLQTAGASAIEQRLERLSLVYESSKPYLVSRWRWPDRFSP